MNTKQLLVSLLFLAIFISCKNEKASDYKALLAPKERPGDYRTEEKTFASTDFYQNGNLADSAAQQPSPQQTPVSTKPVSNPDWDKKIIKTATLNLEVGDFKKYNETVHKTIKQYGGYVAQEEQNMSDERSETTISIKVPVDQFDDMMNDLPAQSTKVIERKITTEDVTGEVVDTKSRLEAKKTMRLKYLDFLKQSKNMEEVLQVQKEINSIQEEIESAAGRINFLSHQASFSTINLTFFQPVIGFKPPVDDKPGFFKRLAYAFDSGLEWFSNLIVGLASVWPFVLAIIIVIITWKRAGRNKTIPQKAL